MQLIPIRGSTAIRAIGYRGRVMQVLFVGGNLKTYRGIPAQTWQDFMAAESKGRWFNQWQKERKDQKRQRNN